MYLSSTIIGNHGQDMYNLNQECHPDILFQQGHDTHENTDCILIQCQNSSFNPHLLLFYFWVWNCLCSCTIPSAKGVCGFSVVTYLTRQHAKSSPSPHTQRIYPCESPNDEPQRRILATRWSSFRVRLAVVDSTFELIPRLRREH